jgi:hypothetical protein
VGGVVKITVGGRVVEVPMPRTAQTSTIASLPLPLPLVCPLLQLPRPRLPLLHHEPSPIILAITQRHNHIVKLLLRRSGSYAPLFSEREGAGRVGGGSTCLVAALGAGNDYVADLIFKLINCSFDNRWE